MSNELMKNDGDDNFFVKDTNPNTENYSIFRKETNEETNERSDGPSLIELMIELLSKIDVQSNFDIDENFSFKEDKTNKDKKVLFTIDIQNDFIPPPNEGLDISSLWPPHCIKHDRRFKLEDDDDISDADYEPID